MKREICDFRRISQINLQDIEMNFWQIIHELQNLRLSRNLVNKFVKKLFMNMKFMNPDFANYSWIPNPAWVNLKDNFQVFPKWISALWELINPVTLPAAGVKKSSPAASILDMTQSGLAINTSTGLDWIFLTLVLRPVELDFSVRASWFKKNSGGVGLIWLVGLSWLDTKWSTNVQSMYLKRDRSIHWELCRSCGTISAPLLTAPAQFIFLGVCSQKTAKPL